MSPAFSRREFLKLSGLTLGSLALPTRILGHSSKPPEATGLVRVTTSGGIQIYDQPEYPRYNDQVKVVATRSRDQLLYVYEKFEADTGPEFNPNWYRILDDLLRIEYYVLAAHLRKIPASELTPLSTRVRPEDKRVEVSIHEQHLWAYEEDAVVLDTKVSTGIPELATTNGIPSYTP